MQSICRVTLIILAALLASCASLPAEKRDIEIYGEEARGPGVFSGESGEIVFFADRPASAPAGDADSSETPPQPSAANWEEFEAFKRWMRARKTQDDDYREFLQWQQFEAYKTWQQKP